MLRVDTDDSVEALILELGIKKVDKLSIEWTVDRGTLLYSIHCCNSLVYQLHISYAQLCLINLHYCAYTFFPSSLEMLKVFANISNITRNLHANHTLLLPLPV